MKKWLALGILCGLVVDFFVVVPMKRAQYEREYRAQIDAMSIGKYYDLAVSGSEWIEGSCYGNDCLHGFPTYAPTPSRRLP